MNGLLSVDFARESPGGGKIVVSYLWRPVSHGGLHGPNKSWA